MASKCWPLPLGIGDSVPVLDLAAFLALGLVSWFALYCVHSVCAICRFLFGFAWGFVDVAPCLCRYEWSATLDVGILGKFAAPQV